MEWFLRHASLFLIVEENEKVAGFMIVLRPGLNYESPNYVFFCNNYSDFDYVDRIVISKKFRRKKLGTALYEYLFEHSEKDIISCEVNVKPLNSNSLAFHEALGFKEIARQQIDRGQKMVTLMVKKLHSNE